MAKSMGKFHGYLSLTRPANSLMMGIAVIVGAALVRSDALSDYWLTLTFGFVTGFTLTAASMTINDYYDRQIDAVNEPDRPIPSGLIHPNQAVVFSLILTAVGIVTAILTSPLCLVIAVIAWLVAVTYAMVGKRSGLPGNMLVSTCVAVSFIYGSAVAVRTVSLNVVLFASIAFLSNTGREITKGIADVQGDRTRDIKTLAVQYSEKTAAVTATAFYFLAVLFSPIPWFLNFVTFWFLPLVAITDAGLVASSAMLLRDYSRKNAKRIKNTVLAWFLIGLLAFLIGAVR